MLIYNCQVRMSSSYMCDWKLMKLAAWKKYSSLLLLNLHIFNETLCNAVRNSIISGYRQLERSEINLNLQSSIYIFILYFPFSSVNKIVSILKVLDVCRTIYFRQKKIDDCKNRPIWGLGHIFNFYVALSSILHFLYYILLFCTQCSFSHPRLILQRWPYEIPKICKLKKDK